MSATFVLQGLTPQNHISAVADVMQVDEIERVLISVAFVSSTGVDLLANYIRPHATRTTAFIGVRNGITSAQAVKALLDLGVDLKAVDTGSAHLVFHPKLYYARGNAAARLLVGSANLTAGGLNNNIEASVAVALDLSSPEDNELARSVEEQFDELSTKHSANVSAFPEGIALAALLADPRLVDERTASVRTVSRLAGGSGALNPVPLLKMLTKRIVSHLSRRNTPPGRKRAAPPSVAASAFPLLASYELLWTASNLTERDLNIPKRNNTNATGSMNFDKGDMHDGFEFKSYFRAEVFKYLVWDSPDVRGIEVTQAHFHLIIEGVDCGDFALTIRHDTKTNTRSYQQNNAMTKLSWGSAKPFVAKDALIGRTMRLSRAVEDATRFLIEVD